MRLTVKDIRDKKHRKEKITALTAYDVPFARILDDSAIDIILVGDSLGMVLLGYESTVPVTMRDMMHHVKAVSRTVKRAMVIADMPFGSYANPAQALRNARRLIQEGGADAVKLEGGRKISRQIEAILQAGIPVMGHLGMMPQSVSHMGGYKVQGRSRKEAAALLTEAKTLDRLGVFSMVLECIPSFLAARVTRQVKCPTIGIGAGAAADGQILVLHDALGFSSKVHPKFVKRYEDLEGRIRKAVSQYRQEVISGKFPDREHSYE